MDKINLQLQMYVIYDIYLCIYMCTTPRKQLMEYRLLYAGSHILPTIVNWGSQGWCNEMSPSILHSVSPATIADVSSHGNIKL